MSTVKHSGELTTTALTSALKRADKEQGDEWLPDGTGRGAGRLFFRAQPAGGRWYFRYTLPGGKRDTLALGHYSLPGRTKDEHTGGGYSLAEARERARELAALLKTPETANIRAHLDNLERAAERQYLAEAEKLRRAQEAEAAQKDTLGRLCLIYCDHLKATGKVSADKVRRDLTRHVLSLALADKPARDVRPVEIAQIVRKLVENGHQRQAGLIRSYLSAAYRLAAGAEGDATAPAALLGFHVETNPVANIRALPTQERHRVLSPDELRLFLKRLTGYADITSDALWMALLAGGQRPQQLLRARVVDYAADEGLLTLLDGKGRRRQPRVHVLPLAPRGQSLMTSLRERAQRLGSPWLFSTAGTVPMDIGTLSYRVTLISRAMVEAGEASEPLQMKDLRRTTETLLAGLKINKDLRAQVLSHGLGGVQARHYDRHDYGGEKREVLALWERRLSAIEAGLTARQTKAAEGPQTGDRSDLAEGSVQH